MRKTSKWVKMISVFALSSIILCGCSANNTNETKKTKQTSSKTEKTSTEGTTLYTPLDTKDPVETQTFRDDAPQNVDDGMLDLFSEMIDGAKQHMSTEIAKIETMDISVSVSRVDESPCKTTYYVNLIVDEITIDESSLKCYGSYDMTNADNDQEKGVALVFGVKAHIKAHKKDKKQDVETLEWHDIDVEIDNNYMLAFKAICIGITTDSSGKTVYDSSTIQYDFSRTPFIEMYCDYYIEDVSMLTDYLDERYLKKLWFKEFSHNYYGPEWGYSEMYSWDPWYKTYKINKSSAAEELEIYCGKDTGLEPPADWIPKEQ